MTRLSDAEIGAFARACGLGGQSVIDAIACAIAASDGNPAYHHQVYPGPVADYRGLYGLDVTEHPDYADVDLFHPGEATRVAAALREATGGWRWCPAYRSGRSAEYLERATPASSMLAGRPRVPSDEVAVQARTAIRSHLERLTETGAAFVRRSKERTGQ